MEVSPVSYLHVSLCLTVCDQRTLSRQEDALSSAQLDVRQVSRGLGPTLEELDQLRQSLDAVMQEVSTAEALREHLGNVLICPLGDALSLRDVI